MDRMEREGPSGIAGGTCLSTAIDVYVILVFAGLLTLTVGYANRSFKTGLGLMVVGIITLLGVIVYYIWTVLA